MSLSVTRGMIGAIGTKIKAKRTDKPGSVVGDHLSCLHVTVQFHARYPNAGRAGPWRSYLRLLRMGFTKPPCCHDAGGLLHHRFSFSLTRTWRAAGVFFSAALSVESPRLAVSQHPALWSPDFPHMRTCRTRDRLARFAMEYCSTPRASPRLPARIIERSTYIMGD